MSTDAGAGAGARHPVAGLNQDLAMESSGSKPPRLTLLQRPGYGSRRHNILWPRTLMRCPWCDADDDRVVDSRPPTAARPSVAGASAARADAGTRRSSGSRTSGSWSSSGTGSKEPFDRAKLESGILKAIKNRPVTPSEVETGRRRSRSGSAGEGPEVTSQAVGAEVLASLAQARPGGVPAVRVASTRTSRDHGLPERAGRRCEKKTPAKPRSR